MISVQIEKTNSPSIIKFTHNGPITNGSYEFHNVDETKNSPLGKELFFLPFTKKVYITANFIAIEKYDIVEWDDVAEDVREQIEAYLNRGNQIILSGSNENVKSGIEIYSESTPNPDVMKFVANKRLVSQNFEYKNIADSQDAPIAESLFKNFDFVNEVFISENYISVTKSSNKEWQEVLSEVRDHIKTFITDGNTIIKESAIPSTEENNNVDLKNLDEVSIKIVSILNEFVKPAVASDGGNIQFAGYEADTKTVHVILQGACSGCPSSTITLKNGIETMLKEMIPNEIESVVAING